MNLTNHYTSLYTNAIEKISSGNYQLDNQIDSPLDLRRGLTLIIRPNELVKTKMQEFISRLKEIDPNQYYYANSDIHITLLSIISCYNDFNADRINMDAYIERIKQCINVTEKIPIEFKGVTASPSCVMIQGFMANNGLNTLRDNLRNSFKNSTLEQSIDKRYSIQTAHATMVRFRKPLTQPKSLLKILDNYRTFNFGTHTVDAIELVTNDWYMRAQNVTPRYRFEI